MNEKLVYLSKEISGTLRNPGSSIQVGREWGVRKRASLPRCTFFFKHRRLTPGTKWNRWESTKSNSGRISALTFSYQLSALNLDFDFLRERGRSFNRADKCLGNFPGFMYGSIYTKSPPNLPHILFAFCSPQSSMTRKGGCNYPLLISSFPKKQKLPQADMRPRLNGKKLWFTSGTPKNPKKFHGIPKISVRFHENL